MMARREAFSFKIEGMKELDKMLKELPKSTRKTVVRNSLKKAAKPIADAYKRNIPQSGRATGKTLADRVEITSKLKPSQRSFGPRDRTMVEMFVGSSAPHAHLVEFGTGPRYQKETGRYTGSMPPNPYLRNAFDATRRQALEILRDEMWKNIMRSAERIRKKAVRGTLGKRQHAELLAKSRQRWFR